MGKGEGGGSAGIVSRFLAGIGEVEHRWKELVKTGRPLDKMVVVGLGDLVESCSGHYAMQAFQADLDRREQVTVLRRILVKALTHWATFAPQIIVAAVPGNHGENRANGKAYTSFGDNDDVAVMEQVGEIIRANPAYDHIAFVFPKNELTLTLDVHGTILGLAHGHQVKGSAESWWGKQAFGMQPIGDADILLTGHYHHLAVKQSGQRTHFQAPALDGGSQWFTEQAGVVAPAGLLTFTVSRFGWDDLRVLPCTAGDPRV
jgi:predicted phosphodiesterase